MNQNHVLNYESLVTSPSIASKDQHGNNIAQRYYALNANTNSYKGTFFHTWKSLLYIPANSKSRLALNNLITILAISVLAFKLYLLHSVVSSFALHIL